MTSLTTAKMSRAKCSPRIIEPSTWKKFHDLHGGDKEPARQRALQLFPNAHAMFARKKDHGRAKAALIALAGNKTQP
jgi:crossover junction endodeoxyribonuclease RuvC